MPDTDDRKDKFHAAINHYAEEQRKKIEDEIASFSKKELDEAEIEVLTECYRLIQNEMAQMRNAVSRETAQKEINARRELLGKRQHIEDTVFERAANTLRDFTKQEQYAEFLKKSAAKFAETFHEPGTVIRLKDGDEKYEQMIRSTFGECTFETDHTIGIGGIRAYHPQIGIMADETLDTLLEGQREWFEEHSGMTVV